MDESSRNSYPQISVRDWRLHGYIDHDETKSYHPLASSIHPIFSFLRTKPKPGSIDQSFQRWGTLAAKEYQSLRPVLCLASLMLVSPASLRFFHSIMYGPRRQTSNRHDNLPVYEFSRSDATESEVREQTLSALEKLSESLSFDLVDNLLDDSCGLAQPRLGNKSNGISLVPTSQPTGVAGFVSVNRKHFALHEQLLNHPTANRSQNLSFQLRMAITLCHEVAHTFNFAADPNFLKAFLEYRHGDHPPAIPNEPFFENQKVAELGYCWETEVLGGHVPQEENPNEALFVEEWPSWVHHSPEREPDRALPKPISARWLISMQYVRDIQSQDWWDSPPRRLINDRILWPQKTYGLSAKYEGTKFDHDWASSDEGRAYLLGQGLLVVEREQGFSTVAAKESLSGRWKGLFKKLIL